MEIKIFTKEIPPKTTGDKGRSKWPLTAMKPAKRMGGKLIGDCFEVAKKDLSKVRVAARRLGSRQVLRITTRVVGDKAYIWRLK